MRILRKPAVKDQLGHRSDTSISNRVEDGTLTKPVKLGLRAVGWFDQEIDAICAAQVAGKSREEIKALVTRLHHKRAELAVF
jgi:prophage regulatory protein